MSFFVAASVGVLSSSLEVVRSIPDEFTYFFFSFFTPITDPGWGAITTPWPAWGGGTPGHQPATKIRFFQFSFFVFRFSENSKQL